MKPALGNDAGHPLSKWFFGRRQRLRSTPVDTGMHHCTPTTTGVEAVQTGANNGVSAPVPSANEDTEVQFNHPFMMVGAIRSASEHAVQLLETVRKINRETGLETVSFYQGTLQDLHQDMCKNLGWCGRHWNAIGRELKKLPGVRESKVWVDGRRLTFYEIGPVSEAASNVLPHPAVVRKRA